MEDKPKKQRRKKKPNKAARDRMKAEKANEYNVAFSHGYKIGYEIGLREGMNDNQHQS